MSVGRDQTWITKGRTSRHGRIGVEQESWQKGKRGRVYIIIDGRKCPGNVCTGEE